MHNKGGASHSAVAPHMKWFVANELHAVSYMWQEIVVYMSLRIILSGRWLHAKSDPSEKSTIRVSA